MSHNDRKAARGLTRPNSPAARKRNAAGIEAMLNAPR